MLFLLKVATCSHYLNACFYMIHNYACQDERLERKLLIEHASSMHWYTSVLVQRIMHTTIENTSSAYGYTRIPACICEV